MYSSKKFFYKTNVALMTNQIYIIQSSLIYFIVRLFNEHCILAQT